MSDNLEEARKVIQILVAHKIIAHAAPTDIYEKTWAAATEIVEQLKGEES